MSNEIPRFHLARAYSDGVVEPSLHAVGEVPLDTVANRRGFLGAGVATAGLVATTAFSASAIAQSGTPITSGIEGAAPCVQLPAATDQTRAHVSPVVDLEIDDTANAIATRDLSGRIKIWIASTLALERTMDVKRVDDLRACGYFLTRSGRDKALGKSVIIGKEEAIELDLVDGQTTELTTKSDHLRRITPESWVHFVDSRTLISITDRTLSYFDLLEGRDRLTLAIPGNGTKFTASVSPDGKWLAIAAADSLQLWSIYRGVQLWTHRFNQPSSSDPLSTVGFLTRDLRLVCVAKDRRITIHDRRTGKVVVRRSLEAGAGPAVREADGGTGQLDEGKGDHGLKPIWEAGYGPSSWNLGSLSRQCTIPVAPRPSWLSEQTSRKFARGAAKQFAILSAGRRGFALSGTNHVVGWSQERPGDINYLIDPELAKAPQPSLSPSDSTPSSGIGGGVICTCNKVCTCIPVRCQAHELLNSDPAVRAMTEELLLIVGPNGFEYMNGPPMQHVHRWRNESTP